MSDGVPGSAVDAPPTTEELLEILNNIPGMIALWDPDGRNRFANGAYVEWFGMSPTEIRGRHISELLGPELYELNRPFIDGALAGELQLFERTLADSSGIVRYVQAAYVPRVLNGARAGFFVLVSDISPRVRAQKALQDSVRQLALLEERQRIAADLHDLVIQRLFGAGLELAAVFRAGPERATEVWPKVQSAAEGVDDAIRELRRAIHSLRELMVRTPLPEDVERVIGQAGRALDFVPSVAFSGSLEAVPPEVVQDLLAVLREALSNVARHAGATQVNVTLACVDDELLLQVIDDGTGVVNVARTSGLSNMRQRAERHGGSLKIGDNVPRGTVVEWIVPLTPPVVPSERPA